MSGQQAELRPGAVCLVGWNTWLVGWSGPVNHPVRSQKAELALTGALVISLFVALAKPVTVPGADRMPEMARVVGVVPSAISRVFLASVEPVVIPLALCNV